MKDLLAYGLMALVIAALCLINWVKSRPVHQAADRFGLLFLEARDSVLGAAPPLPETRATADGSVQVLPPAQQPAAVRAALAAGAGSAMAGYDRRLEEALEALFLSVGKSGYLRTRYFDYFNSLFTLHKLFLRLCTEPETLCSQEEWRDLTRYWRNRSILSGLVSQRLSATARKASFVNGAGERRETDEAI